MAQTATLPLHSQQTTTQYFIPTSKPKIHDFNVKLLDSTILLPYNKSQTDETKCCFLSNLDQNFNYYVLTLQFFSANPDFPVETVIERLKIAVQKVLVQYDFLAGSVRQNHQSGRLEIDCNATGAGFVVASSEYSLDEIGDLVYQNPGYQHLAAVNLDKTINQPLSIFQVTSFQCGGFSICFSVNHLLFDGMGARMLLENVASQAFVDKPFAVIPCNDRHLLSARSPPRVEFPHPELTLPVSKSNNIIPQEELLSKIFKLSSTQINHLRDKAKPTTSIETKPIKITSFNVVTALIWRCKALSIIDIKNDSVCTLLSAVDIRPRLNPPLPPSYCGNAVVNAYASSKCTDLEDKPFPEIVGIVSNGIARVTDEYARSTLDWLEINKGVPNGDYFISSWWKVGFEQVEYPWGKPVYSLPVMSGNKYVCFLLPPLHPNDNGVNVVVTLPAKEMDKFQSLFYDYFKN